MQRAAGRLQAAVNFQVKNLKGSIAVINGKLCLLLFRNAHDPDDLKSLAHIRQQVGDGIHTDYSNRKPFLRKKPFQAWITYRLMLRDPDSLIASLFSVIQFYQIRGRRISVHQLKGIVIPGRAAADSDDHGIHPAGVVNGHRSLQAHAHADVSDIRAIALSDHHTALQRRPLTAQSDFGVNRFIARCHQAGLKRGVPGKQFLTLLVHGIRIHGRFITVDPHGKPAVLYIDGDRNAFL